MAWTTSVVQFEHCNFKFESKSVRAGTSPASFPIKSEITIVVSAITHSLVRGQ
jgi:hypothetical protein